MAYLRPDFFDLDRKTSSENLWHPPEALTLFSGVQAPVNKVDNFRYSKAYMKDILIINLNFGKHENNGNYSGFMIYSSIIVPFKRKGSN